ncbi:MAG: hypothetical protein V1918_05055, partial [Planctomycetota bacterium]
MPGERDSIRSFPFFFPRNLLGRIGAFSLLCLWLLVLPAQPADEPADLSVETPSSGEELNAPRPTVEMPATGEPARGAGETAPEEEEWDAHPARQRPEPEPVMDSEREAERLERRDELVSAEEAYAAALREAVQAAIAKKEGPGAAWSWARAEFLLEKAHDLSRLTLESASLEEALQSIRSQAALEPVFRARLLWLQANLDLRQGRPEEARNLTDELGLLRDWLILGPFDNQRGRNFETALLPETEPIDLERAYDGLKRPVSWRAVATPEPLGFVNLDAYLSPNDECLAYALCAVYVPDDTAAALRTGSTDMLAAWLNGKPAYPFLGSRLADFDQDAVSLSLRAGWNVLLLKVGEATGEWGFYARITAPDGAPLPGLRAANARETVREALRSSPPPASVASQAAETPRSVPAPPLQAVFPESGETSPEAASHPVPETALSTGAISALKQTIQE